MKTQKLRKILFFMPILPFTLTLIFFATNASARHIETRAGWAANGIASSYHNLSSSGPYVSNGRFTGQDPATLTPSQLAIAARGTTEMCVYCHTPHFADRGKGPLWNRNFTGTVEAYGTTIAKNNDGNGNANMFSTIGCLSCHDGVTTFDNIINQPGKDTGNVQARTGSYRWGFTMPSYKDSGLSMPTWDHFASAACTGCHENEMMEGVAPRLDISRLIIGEQDSPGLEGKTNLSNDHPIGVVYRGAGDPNASASLRARTVAISGINMDIETENGAPMPRYS